ncbi:MAG: hypothetical protein JWM88_712 [Verrucomicrobia bacterium]|nr:hypothetical protein [Verrucomicrobiota bacterium]
MSFEEFLSSAAPPEGAGAALAGLWHDAHWDWSRAHASVQDDPGRDAAWVHAYLHRREGDDSNAGYWYARAGRSRPKPGAPLDAEREAIVRALL